MKGSCIVVAGNPKGVFLEGGISDTSLPGTIMQINVSAGLNNNGEPTWQAANTGTSGLKCQYAILREDRLQGGLTSTAYVSGTRAFLYIPLSGEDINVRVGQTAGTGNYINYGDILMPDSSNGVLIEWSGTGDRAFQAMETISAVAADTLVWCRKY